MPLDRKAVDKTAGEHIRHAQLGGAVSEEKKAAIRKLHQDMARKVEVDARRRKR